MATNKPTIMPKAVFLDKFSNNLPVTKTNNIDPSTKGIFDKTKFSGKIIIQGINTYDSNSP